MDRAQCYINTISSFFLFLIMQNDTCIYAKINAPISPLLMCFARSGVFANSESNMFELT